MKLTRYDKAASMLIALLILVGTAVAVLLGLWLSAQAFGRPLAVPVTLVPIGDGAGTGEDDAIDPNVLEPGTAEQDEPTLLEDMESVIDIISDNAALFTDSTASDDMTLLPAGRPGDGRTRGDGVGLAGRARRWEIQFPPGMTAEEYAAILDHFGIELGVLRPGGKVVYVSDLASPVPAVREGDSVEEKRYYLTWVKGDTIAADRELLAKAKVETEGRLILKFLPPALEADLDRQEKDRAGARFDKVNGSFFRVVREKTGFRFQIYHQIY